MFILVSRDVVVMDLETKIDESNHDGKNKNDRYETGVQMEAENATIKIITVENLEGRQILPQAENFQLGSETMASAIPLQSIDIFLLFEKKYITHLFTFKINS